MRYTWTFDDSSRVIVFWNQCHNTIGQVLSQTDTGLNSTLTRGYVTRAMFVYKSRVTRAAGLHLLDRIPFKFPKLDSGVILGSVRLSRTVVRAQAIGSCWGAGSGTSAKGGIRQRIAFYNRGTVIARRVAAAVFDVGYRIVQQAVLLYCSRCRRACHSRC